MRTSAEHLDYAQVRAATPTAWERDDPRPDAGAGRRPRATAARLLRQVAGAGRAEYRERLATWRKWQPLAPYLAQPARRSNVISIPSTPPGPMRPLTSAAVIALSCQP